MWKAKFEYICEIYKKGVNESMTVNDLVQSNHFRVFNQGELDRKVSVPFCCDLLSIAMSKAPADSVWITVMGNMNTLAVASLADVSCLILAEGVVLDDASIKKAKEQNITVFYTDMPIFEAAIIVHKLIHD